MYQKWSNAVVGGDRVAESGADSGAKSCVKSCAIIQEGGFWRKEAVMLPGILT